MSWVPNPGPPWDTAAGVCGSRLVEHSQLLLPPDNLAGECREHFRGYIMGHIGLFPRAAIGVTGNIQWFKEYCKCLCNFRRLKKYRTPTRESNVKTSFINSHIPANLFFAQLRHQEQLFLMRTLDQVSKVGDAPKRAKLLHGHLPATGPLGPLL